MSKERFQHFTFNTGHRMFQYARDFRLDKAEKCQLRRLAQESLRPEGTNLIANITFEAVKEKDMYVGTLFSNIGTDKVPLLTTFGARTPESAQRLWEVIQEDFSTNRNVTRWKRCNLQAPFVLDLLHNCCMPDAQAARLFTSGMSSYFCKCIGWAFLFPELIEEHQAKAAKDGGGPGMKRDSANAER